MADVLAEAVVELEADVDKANKELKAAFKQMDKEAKDAAKDIDNSFKQMSGDLGNEFKELTRKLEREFRQQEREAARTAREIEREFARTQREMEREAKRVQREIERETARVARENEKAQREYEREFIASQKAMEKAHRESQERQAERVRSTLSTVRRFASERFSLTLGIDSSQITSALGSVTKLGAALGVLGVGALAGQASLAGLASITVAVQELVGAIALLPAAGAAAGAVVGTLALGLRGLGDAISADSPAELAEAFEKLSENGKKFVTTIRDLKDEFDDLAKSVQEELLAGFNDEVKQLASTFLPILRVGFKDLAKEINLNARAFSAFLREAQTIEDVDRIFFNTQESVRILRIAIRPAAQALRDLAAVGSDFLPIIATELGIAATRFGEFIKQARESGELRTFFENALDSVKDLLSVLGNVGSIFGAINKAANAALGGGFLDLLANATQMLEDFLESAQGQTALIQFFEGAQEAAKAILPILGDLARLILEVVLPAFTKLGTIAAPGVGALVDGLREGLETALPGIFAFVDALSDVVRVLVDAGVLHALGNLVRVLGTSLGEAIRTLAPKLADLVTSVLTKLSDILPKILPPLARFAGAFADLAIAALPIVDILADIVSQVGLPTLQRIAERLTPIIADLAQELGETLLPILPDLADAFIELVDALAPIVDDLLVIFVSLLRIVAPLLPPFIRGITLLATALTPLVEAFASIVKPIADFITKLLEIPAVKKFLEEELPGLFALLSGTILGPLAKIVESIKELIQIMDDAGIFDTFKTALDNLGKVLVTIGAAFERFRDIVTTVFNTIKAVIEFVITFIVTVITTGFNIITTIITTALEIIATIFSTIWEIIKAIVDAAVKIIIAILTGNFAAIPGIVRDALGRMRDAAVEGFNRLIDIVRDIPNRITSALGNLGSTLYNAGRDLVQGLINGMGSMLGALGEKARGLASSAVSAALGALKITSPSKVMMEVGEQFGQGFVAGIDNMLRKAAEAGSDIATQTVTASRETLAPSDNATYRMNETLNRLTRNGFGPVAPAVTTSANTEAAQQSTTLAPEVHVYIGNEEIDQHVTEIVDERDRRKKRALSMGGRRTL